MYAYSTSPSSRSCSIERATRSIGTAKPTPWLPPEVVSICWLIPITLALGVEQRPARVAGVDRGVGLDRAVDLELGQRRDRAVGRRDHADRERLALAERAADRGDRLADLDVVERAQLDRVELESLGIDLQQGDVRERVEADDLGLDLVAVGELDVDLAGGVDLARCPSAWPSVTTWALVTISPSSEMTKPDPWPACGPGPPSGSVPSGKIELIVTTPGAALS